MTEQSQVSETALSTAFLRALSCYENDQNGQDYLAEIFLPQDRRIQIKNTGYRNIAKERIQNGTYEYVAARTSYFDKFFLDCLKDNFAQIVLLGAGYDSRAYRFKEYMQNSQIFEVDASFTQNQKIDILNYNNISSSHVNFVAVDFEKDSLTDMLFVAGFDKQKKTAFIWEGVTLYLSKEAVQSTLRNIMEISSTGSLLGFDYLNFNPDKAPKIIRKDEIVQFGTDKKSMETFMGNYGFSVIENLETIKPTMNFLKAVFKHQIPQSD